MIENIAEALHIVDVALSWSFPLLGTDHPMAVLAVHVSRSPLLNHEDTNRLGQNT
jgi:hypothetical protein